MNGLLAAPLVLLAAGLLEVIASRFWRSAGGVACLGAPLAALLGAGAVIEVLSGGPTRVAELPWSMPGGALSFALDPLSAFFLVPVLALSALAAIYGRPYLAPYADRRRLYAPWLSFNLLCAAMIVVLLARDALLFLLAWETMSLCAYLLVTFEHERAEARRAGWIYLVAAHAGTAALIALFILLDGALGAAPGSEPTRHAHAGGLLALALLGFGVKAGIVPLHVWLPEAHAAAPSHVSALMSGAMVKLGFYGILRMVLVLGGTAPIFGVLLGALGLAGALVGISLALSQRDLKRALAYSSVENLGLIALGLGIGLTGLAHGEARLAALGLAAALFHVWSHAAMKGMLFFAAGSVQHATHTRDLERLGGLLRRMPRAGVVFALGALALAGLPPLSGFVTEWLLYLGLLHAVAGTSPLESIGAALAVGLLALAGALAAAAFVRLFGVAFLGEPRSSEARAAHDASGSMLAPMAGLALVCIGLGLAPGIALVGVAAPLQQLLGSAAGETPLAHVSAALAPLPPLALALWLAFAGVGGALALRLRRAPVAPDVTWACGYTAVSTRMQYTARSFSELFTRRVLPPSLAPATSASVPRGILPASVAFDSSHGEPLTERIYEPLFSAVAARFAHLRRLQQGNAHLYLAYILVAVVAALTWASLREWLNS
ncbi:MAG: proton-conducting transporter membrane subunit [Myxococcota bacterium]